MLTKDNIFTFLLLLEIIFAILSSNQQLCIISVMVDCCPDGPD